VWSRVGLECAHLSYLSYLGTLFYLILPCAQRRCRRCQEPLFMYLNPPFWPSESQAICAPLHSFHPFLFLGGRRPSHLVFQGSLTRTKNVQVCNISFDFKALGSWIVRSAYEQVTCWSHVTDFGEEGLKLAKLSRNEVYEMGGRMASPSISGASPAEESVGNLQLLFHRNTLGYDLSPISPARCVHRGWKLGRA
jgi:hypothetical protein